MQRSFRLFSDQLLRSKHSNVEKYFYETNELQELMGMYMGKRKDIARGFYPKGIYEVTKEAWDKYKKPIYITENGYFGDNDQRRQKFIIDHLSWLYQAIEEGVDIRGYQYWSLIDNFEWHLGRKIKYGLFEVDYSSFDRIAKKSAYLYGKIAKENSLTIGG